ncbi:MAG: glycosyltransferase family 39 protein, partial [Chloroflexota bacterium]
MRQNSSTPIWARLAVLAYTAVVGTAFALLVPPFEAPDEPAHLAYIDFVAAQAVLPDQYGPLRPLTGHEISPTEGHQPPLYYAAAALLLRLTSQSPCMPTPPPPNPLHAWNGRGGSRTDVPMFQPEAGLPRRAVDAPCLLLLREGSVLLGVLQVAAALALARHFFADHWRLLPAVLVATLPQFLFLSGVVSNDGLANLLVALCLLCSLRLLDHPERVGAYLRLGLLLGLALLAKKTSLFVLPGLAALAGYLAYGHRGRRGRIAAGSAITLGLAVAVCGWWFARNAVLY